MNDDGIFRLSDAGIERRQTIRALGIRQTRARRRRRLAARVGGAGFAGAVAAVAWVGVIGDKSPSPVLVEQEVVKALPPGRSPMAPGAPASSVVTVVHGDPNVTARFVLSPREGLLEIVGSDQQLLDLLAEARKPAGLVYQNGQTTVLFRAGADDDLP